ncbi:MAG: hypothetical protein HY648_01350 [Acidobacteria bacterium]|nr:hypothetical protein [Acidobacteriota bacterium]
MPVKNQIRDYIRGVRRRLRWQTTARGLAICGAGAFLLTISAVLWANAWNFSDTVIRASGAVLWLTLGSALAYFLLRPLLKRIPDYLVARFVEEKHPEFQDRLVTAVELADRSSTDESARLFAGLLAEDALTKAGAAPPAALIEHRKILRPLAVALGSVAAILLLGFFGPGIFRYGTRVLWIGWAEAKVEPLYQLQLSPGNLTVARNSDQEVAAQPTGFAPGTVRLFALYGDSASWESAPMIPEENGGGFRFLLMNIRAPIQYYAEADGVRSPRYRLSVTDVPRIERLEVRYHYPTYTGLPDRVEPQGGDIAALRGTTVTVVAHTDTPATGGRLVMDNGKELPLQRTSEKELQARWTLSQDAMYHVRLQDHQGQETRASQEYLIQALADASPQVRLLRPGRDLDPTPIEEVIVSFEGRDDVRLAELQMRYAINGGEEKTVSLGRGGQETTGEHTLFLEDHHLIPGDLVTFYGVARDAAGNSTQSDIYFLQTRPFERSYTQGRAGGGGGGNSGENTFLSQQQKEIIAATWNLIRKKDQLNPGQRTEAAQTMSSVQSALREQAATLASRIGRRELTGVNEEFKQLVENLQRAAEAMEPAASLLGSEKFQQALSPEQTALQHLLRAEALFREIQVAFGNSGGGGGSQNSGQDLADLFALELDTEKNQYETLREYSGQSGNSTAEVNEAMRKLQELARRQEALARQEQERRKESLQAASRWEQEMLRRETEELAHQLEELSRQANSSQLAQAGKALSQAARDMQQASGQSGSDGRSERTRAMQRLQEARSLLAGQQNRWNEETMQQLAESAENMARQQQKIAENTRSMAAEEKAGSGSERSVPEMMRQNLSEKQNQLESLRDLEKQINEAAGRMAADEKKASQQLRGASSSIQEERMADKIRQGAWLSQRGVWPMATNVEDDLRSDLENLGRQLRDAQRSLQGGGSEEKLREALEAAERVRQGLESLGQQQQSGGQDAGRQPRQQGQQQQRGENGQRAQGEQPGSEQSAGQQGQQGQQAGQGQSGAGSENQGGQGSQQAGSWTAPGTPSDTQRGGFAGRWTGQYRGDARNFGDMRPGTPLSPEELRQLDEQYRNLARDAADLRGLLAEYEQFSNLAQELAQAMRNLDSSRFPGNPELLDRMRADLIERWKELELRLSRQLQLDRPDAVRMAGQERVSDQYRSIVEEYYRSLSRTKR